MSKRVQLYIECEDCDGEGEIRPKFTYWEGGGARFNWPGKHESFAESRRINTRKCETCAGRGFRPVKGKLCIHGREKKKGKEQPS
jgi:hypothetical protein